MTRNAVDGYDSYVSPEPWHSRCVSATCALALIEAIPQTTDPGVAAKLRQAVGIIQKISAVSDNAALPTTFIVEATDAAEALHYTASLRSRVAQDFLTRCQPDKLLFERDFLTRDRGRTLFSTAPWVKGALGQRLSAIVLQFRFHDALVKVGERHAARWLRQPDVWTAFALLAETDVPSAYNYVAEMIKAG